MHAVARQKLSVVLSNTAKFCREYNVLSIGLCLCLAAMFLVNYDPLPRILYWPVLLVFAFVGLSFARQALTTRGLVAYQRPLYQVLALDAAPRETPASREAPAQAAASVADDDPVDIKAVFARIWEVLS